MPSKYPNVYILQVTDIISKYIKDHRKNTALLVLDGLYKVSNNIEITYSYNTENFKICSCNITQPLRFNII